MENRQPTRCIQIRICYHGANGLTTVLPPSKYREMGELSADQPVTHANALAKVDLATPPCNNRRGSVVEMTNGTERLPVSEMGVGEV